MTLDSLSSASSAAFLAAPRANLECRARRLHSSGSSPTSARVQFRTSPEILVGKLLVSKRVVRAMPDSPFNTRFQTLSTSAPSEVTQPRPVITTRCLIDSSRDASVNPRRRYHSELGPIVKELQFISKEWGTGDDFRGIQVLKKLHQ